MFLYLCQKGGSSEYQVGDSNHLNKNAWCIRCLAYHRNLIQNTDTVAVVMTGMVQARTPAELDAPGMFFDLSEVLQYRSSG